MEIYNDLDESACGRKVEMEAGKTIPVDLFARQQ